MNCFYCKGVETIEEGTTRFCACDASTPFIVENVPASVCQLCGDKSFSGETVDALQKINNGECRPTSVQFVKVYDFENLIERPNNDPQPTGLRVSYKVFVSHRLQDTLPNALDAMAKWKHGALPFTEYPAARGSRRITTYKCRSWQGMDKPKSYHAPRFSVIASH